MNFEEAYQKVNAGTATEEEVAYVAKELENLRRLSAILDNPSASDPGIAKVETETVQKARRTFNRKATVRTIIVVLCSLLAIAAITCGIIFIPSCTSAYRNMKVTRDEAVELARACLREQVGENADSYYIDHMHRQLSINGSLTDAVYLYKIEFEDVYDNEYTIKVNAKSGYAMVSDVDLSRRNYY